MMLSSKARAALIEFFRGVIADYRRIFGRDPKDDEVVIKLTYAEVKGLMQALEVE